MSVFCHYRIEANELFECTLLMMDAGVLRIAAGQASQNGGSYARYGNGAGNRRGRGGGDVIIIGPGTYAGYIVDMRHIEAIGRVCRAGLPADLGGLCGECRQQVAAQRAEAASRLWTEPKARFSSLHCQRRSRSALIGRPASRNGSTHPG